MPDGHENQLELFDLAAHVPPPPHRETLGGLFLNLRYDHLALASIGTLLTITVVFACGVERGKHLARAERLWMDQQTRTATGPTAARRVEEPATRTAEGPPVVLPQPSKAIDAPVIRTPATAPKAPMPSLKKAPTRSRYAVQVRTYQQPQLARMELERLKAKGESAFIVIREGRTSVYVGPFPSKADASKKLAMLKTRYEDCFVRSL